jgi:adenylate cyclase
MPARLRALIIALLLGGVASIIGVVLETLPLTTLPVANRIADLVAHVNMLDSSQRLGFGLPNYDNAPNPNLGIITIDDITLKGGTLGPWPFPRSVYGTLLKKLKAAGAKAVAFDIDFIEASTDPTQDARFAEGMRELPTVLGFTINTTSNSQIGEELPAADLRSNGTVGYSSVDTPGGYLIGQPVEIDTSGTGKHSNEHLLSLAAGAVTAYRRQPIDVASIPKLDGTMLLLPPKLPHTQDIATATEIVTPTFAGRGQLSFADAYAATPAQLRPFADGALIYIGSTAQGLHDFSPTARGIIAGLYINARFADQLMRKMYLTPAPLWLGILLCIVLPLMSALGFSLMRTPYAIAVSVIAILVYSYVNLYLFTVHLYWIDLVHVCLAMLLGTMFVAIYRVINEGSQRRMVTNLFGMHVSPAIVSDILSQDDPKGALALRGKRVKATIFYSDIRGFTSMSETMTPEEIYGQLNEYFEEMCKIIFEYGGYVDKFIGDCVMAVFSAPYQTPDDARNAVISAVKQQDKILELSARWKAEGKKEFTVGMGVNTGDVVMGNLGASSRMNYTVIGDNVNVAARLYNVAKGGEIIISETTYAECKDVVEVDELEPVSVKGKVAPISIYNVKGLKQGAEATVELLPA